MPFQTQQQLADYVIAASHQFVGSYLRANQCDPIAVKKYMHSAIASLVVSWTAAHPATVPLLNETDRRINAIVAELRTASVHGDLGEFWYLSIRSLGVVFKENPSIEIPDFLEEIVYTQATVIIQLLRFAKDPLRVETLVF